MWTYGNLSQTDAVAGGYSSYNNIIELQVNYYIESWKWMISVPNWL